MGTRLGLFLVRIYCGATFLLAGIGKIWPGYDFSKFSEGWLKQPILKGILEGAAGTEEAPGTLHAGLGWYGELVRNVFLENVGILNYLVVFGELLVGIGLLIGLLARVSAAFAIAMTAAFFLLTWEAGFLPWTILHNWAFAVGMLCLVVLISGAGLYGGVDGRLRRGAA